MWNELTSESDLNSFMKMHYGFHDSCIKEMKYMSGAYVNENLGMWPANSKRVLRMIVQRQFEGSSVIEMEFEGLVFLKLFPNDEDYTCEILDATMIWKEDCIFWCDYGGLTEAEIADFEGTAICAQKVRWRIVNEYLGDKEVYVSV